MKPWYGASAGQIRALERAKFVDDVAGHLSKAFSFRAIAPEQHDAWSTSAGWIWDWISQLPKTADVWIILFEYATPLVTSRPDVVIVTQSRVLVVEFKTGLSKSSSAVKQALGYAKDLYWFHPGARGRAIVPILIEKSGSKSTKQVISMPVDAEPQHVLRLAPADAPRLLNDFSDSEFLDEAPSENLWLHAQYRPRPSIVDAAVALFAQNEDPGVSAALSNDAELDNLTNMLVNSVHEAAIASEHRVLLVNGVPGAGKTLVGLRLAYDVSVVSRLREIDSHPLYLTGNGPLVGVLTEALARDFHRRNEATGLEDARRRAATLVKLVHAFTRDGLAGVAEMQVPHVAIFDEGQRVWDGDQMKKKHGFGAQPIMTEPEVILRNLEQQSWAVVVVLVGEGQEINAGEVGARLWVEAARARAETGGPMWRVYGSPALADTSELDVVTQDLFLGHSRRSEGASWLAEWVEAVIAGDAQVAQKVYRPSEFQAFVTRDLAQARAWLRTVGGRSRYGLVASARAGRLRPYGIEMDADFQAGMDWRNWFLDRPPSLESSCSLEVAASEFKCQGLELDYVGLCWSWDLVRPEGEWIVRRLNSRNLKWSPTRGDRYRYGLNAYRVLLTRARAGMVIWVPEGDCSDATRPPKEMDAVYEFLQDCGLPSL